MGNVASATTQRKTSSRRKSQKWNWEFRNGRMQVKPRGGKPAAAAPRPLFLRRTSRNLKTGLWFESNSNNDDDIDFFGRRRRPAATRRR